MAYKRRQFNLVTYLMESASLRNASDFEELRSEYMKLTLELRGSTIGSEPVLEAVKAPEGFKEKIAAVLKNIFSPEDFGNHWVPPNIDTGKKVLTMAQKLEFKEQAKEWKKFIELMELAQRRVRIFVQERQQAIAQIEGGNTRYGKSETIKAHQKLRQAEQEIVEHSRQFNELSRQLFQKIGDVLTNHHS